MPIEIGGVRVSNGFENTLNNNNASGSGTSPAHPLQTNPSGNNTSPTSGQTSHQTSNLTNGPTTAEQIASSPTTAEILGATSNPADHRYTISTRSFAPPESFGGGFQGDDRGYTTDLEATSRIHSTVTIDADDQANITANDVSAHSDPSVHHAIPFYAPTETPTVDILSQQVAHDGDVSTIAFETRHSGKDAVPEVPDIRVPSVGIPGSTWPSTPAFNIPGFNPSPSLDVNTNLEVVSDRENNTLQITGQITGDNFPATEVFINDQNGQAVFLATGKPPAIATPIVNLLDFGHSNRAIADVDTTINTDESGNFLSVESDGQTYSIEEWNQQFESRDPGFTDPLAPINNATLELREGYGEIGDEFNEAISEIGAANNPLAATYETGEAIVEIASEGVEAGVSVAGGYVAGKAEVAVNVADAVLPGDGIPFVDLNLPEAPGWWPGN